MSRTRAPMNKSQLLKVSTIQAMDLAVLSEYERGHNVSKTFEICCTLRCQVYFAKTVEQIELLFRMQTSIHRISSFESPKMRGLPISVPKTLQFCSFLSNMSDAVKCKTITLCHTLSLSARFYSYQSSWQSSLRERGMLLPCRVCPIYQCSCSHFSCCVLCSISLDNITILPPVS